MIWQCSDTELEEKLREKTEWEFTLYSVAKKCTIVNGLTMIKIKFNEKFAALAQPKRGDGAHKSIE